MAYTALYRKWRPASFADVKGQDAIVTTLKNQIRLDRIGHAYLFCGTRGTGKTTVAKIFARTVNCEHPVDGEPCGTCEICRAIEAGASMNVVEIDAASNNGVDNIREIRDEVQYSPAEGKYRVYIIDEAHMLSTGAFNALLKTLEEPPSYVIFILATTEPHKIPVTVLSRCQRYDFRRMTTEVLMERLTELAEYEQVKVEEQALRYIAKKADGAMRDAISLLDQCIAFHIGEDLTYEMVLAVLGAVDNERFSRFLRGILRQDSADCLLQIEELVMDGRELGQFVQDFIWYMRNLLLLTSSDVGNEVLDLTKEDWVRLQEEAAMTDPASLMRLIRIFSELYNQMRNAVNKRVLLEIAVIRTAQPQMEENLESLEERLSRLERKMAEGIPAALASLPAPVSPGSAKAVQTEEEPEPVVLPPAEYEDLMLIRQEWDRILNSIERVARSSLLDTRVEPRGQGILCVVFFDAFHYNMCKTLQAMDQVKDFVAEAYGKSLEFDLRLAPQREQEPRYLTDEDLAGIHGDIEIEDEEP
ncbi:MAG: DNA polymerase III subunit gamma/tau [Lachnospiraceae bacterium]|nr:DNA polymerase III subunit gamma/tau [Lachnospiraceae bacterium]